MSIQLTINDSCIEQAATDKREVRRKLLWMVGVALALRLLAMAYLYPLQLAPDSRSAHWPFGYETGQIAASIAEGHGFSSPLFANTGPTAWMTPVYPYIVAGVFKVFGVFTTASALVILTFNAITSALTCLPIFFFARRTFGGSLGERAGQWAGWIWAVFPFAIYWSMSRIWDTWLATLLLAILFCMALRLAETNRAREWIAFGALSGVAALTDAVVLSVLPFLALWALWRLYKSHAADKSLASVVEPKASTSASFSGNGAGLKKHSNRRGAGRLFLCAASCVLATLIVVAPWFVRNYVVFHRFVPFRDVFPLALRVGNVGDQYNMITLTMGPWESHEEWQKYQKYGELGYMQDVWGHATSYIADHPDQYVYGFLRRMLYIWTGFWYRVPKARYGYDPEPAEILLYTLLSVLAFLGLRIAIRKKEAVAPYAIVMIFFPIVYYGTSIEPWYRAPLDPFLIGLAGYAIASLGPNSRPRILRRLLRRQQSAQMSTSEVTDAEVLFEE